MCVWWWWWLSDWRVLALWQVRMGGWGNRDKSMMARAKKAYGRGPTGSLYAHLPPEPEPEQVGVEAAKVLEAKPRL